MQVLTRFLAPSGTDVRFGPGAFAGLDALVVEAEGASGGRPRVGVVASQTGSRLLAGGALVTVERFDFAAQVPSGYPSPVAAANLEAALAGCSLDVVVAIGGGAVLDLAKAASVGLEGVPLIVVPTTHGSGAEVTPFAALWDLHARVKTSVEGVAPTYALVDPDLTLSAPREVTASSLLDTLAQGIEASWSIRSTFDSRVEAFRAIELVARVAVPLLGDLNAASLRSQASLAGLASGKAISESQTTICHALSYPITLEHGVAHGYACALTLAAAFEYNAGTTASDCRDPRGVDHVRAVVREIESTCQRGGWSGPAALVGAIVGAGALPDVDRSAFDAQAITASVLASPRAANNPRELDRDAVCSLLDVQPMEATYAS